MLDGNGLYVIEATPRQGYQPQSGTAKVLAHIEGKLWVDKQDYNLSLYLVNPDNPVVCSAHIQRSRLNTYRVWNPLGRPSSLSSSGSEDAVFLSHLAQPSAIVLSDLASSAYRRSVKPHPWFVLGIMLFSYAVKAVYWEICRMFVRGGVYKVVHYA